MIHNLIYLEDEVADPVDNDCASHVPSIGLSCNMTELLGRCSHLCLIERAIESHADTLPIDCWC